MEKVVFQGDGLLVLIRTDMGVFCCVVLPNLVCVYESQVQLLTFISVHCR